MKNKFIGLIALLVVSICLHAQNVGIGTSTPKARLHVADSAVLFTGPAVVPGSTIYDPPASGQGTRMMWYPQKAAFRAGAVSALFNNIWDKNLIGVGSIGLGINPLASGESSVAIGSNTNAIGAFSIALGLATFANADYSSSIGYDNNASGLYATAIGTGNFAGGEYSTAIGNSNSATGNSSTAMGKQTTAQGANAMAIGFGTRAKAFASLSIGQYNDEIFSSQSGVWFSSDPVFIIGNGTAPANKSNAMVVFQNGNTDINGFTQLGKATENAPAIKMKKLTATSAITQNGNTFVAHGLSRAKILGVQILLTYAANLNDIPANYMDVAGYEFNWQLTNTDVWIITKNGNSANILSKPMRILITYEE